MSDGESSSGALNPLQIQSRRSKWNLMCYLGNWANSQTAAFCQDYETPKEFDYPQARVTIRLLFTVILCMIMLTAVLVFLFKEDNSFKTVRYWGSSYAEQQFTPIIYSINATQNLNFKSITASTLCPCSTTAISWTSYVQFYTISYTTEGVLRGSAISNGSEFCTNELSHLNISKNYITRIGCPNLVNSIVSGLDARTVLESTSLMDPVLLNASVGRHIQSNLLDSLNDCVYLMANSTNWNENEPFYTLRNIYEAFSDMLKLYSSNPHVSDTEFWVLANETVTAAKMPLLQVLDDKQALGIQVDWVSYLKQCGPIYCDVVKQVSFAAKFLTFLAEIGGFGAFFLIVIRKVLWPLVQVACGWKNM